jgi:glycosyltransferase involved in cell wall biosynthesis
MRTSAPCSRPVRPLLSIVVPCFNEEAVIETTHRRLADALAPLEVDAELIYVDDGSSDATAEQLGRLYQSDSRVRALRLARNFGHQIAATAGIEHAAGDVVLLIDADLQDPPELIGPMLVRWREGYDVVYGQRVERAGETWFKRATARWFYRLINRLSEVPIPLDTGDFRLMDRAVVDALCQMPEHARFLRGMVSWVGFRQTALPYHRAKRLAGTTKYPLRKMLRLASDAVVAFSLTPLRWATWLGGLAVAGGLVAVIAILAAMAAGWRPGAVLLVGLLVGFFGGAQLLCIGILGEYVGRVHREAQRRPLYLLSEALLGRDATAAVRPTEAAVPQRPAARRAA